MDDPVDMHAHLDVSKPEAALSKPVRAESGAAPPSAAATPGPSAPLGAGPSEAPASLPKACTDFIRLGADLFGAELLIEVQFTSNSYMSGHEADVRSRCLGDGDSRERISGDLGFARQDDYRQNLGLSWPTTKVPVPQGEACKQTRDRS